MLPTTTSSLPLYEDAVKAPPSYFFVADQELCDPALTERLRRWLSFCLAVDYDATKKLPEKLDRTQWLDFVDFLGELADVEAAGSHPPSYVLVPVSIPDARVAAPEVRLSTVEQPRRAQTYKTILTHAELDRAVLRPARELGINPGESLP